MDWNEVFADSTSPRYNLTNSCKCIVFVARSCLAAIEKTDYETLYPLREFAKMLPQQPSVAAVRLWINSGRKNPYTGEHVKLQVRRLTSGWATSMKLYDDFIEALNAE